MCMDGKRSEALAQRFHAGSSKNPEKKKKKTALEATKGVYIYIYINMVEILALPLNCGTVVIPCTGNMYFARGVLFQVPPTAIDTVDRKHLRR